MCSANMRLRQSAHTACGSWTWVYSSFPEAPPTGSLHYVTASSDATWERNPKLSTELAFPNRLRKPWWWLKHSVEMSARISKLSWYQRTLFSVYAGANWEATTSTFFYHLRTWNYCDSDLPVVLDWLPKLVNNGLSVWSHQLVSRSISESDGVFVFHSGCVLLEK